MNLLTAYQKVAGNKKAHPIDQMSLLCNFFISMVSDLSIPVR